MEMEERCVEATQGMEMEGHVWKYGKGPVWKYGKGPQYGGGQRPLVWRWTKAKVGIEKKARGVKVEKGHVWRVEGWEADLVRYGQRPRW